MILGTINDFWRLRHREAAYVQQHWVRQLLIPSCCTNVKSHGWSRYMAVRLHGCKIACLGIAINLAANQANSCAHSHATLHFTATSQPFSCTGIHTSSPALLQPYVQMVIAASLWLPGLCEGERPTISCDQLRYFHQHRYPRCYRLRCSMILFPKKTV